MAYQPVAPQHGGYPVQPQQKYQFEEEQPIFDSYESHKKANSGVELHHTETCLSKLAEVKAKWYQNFANFANDSVPKNILMRLVAPSIVLGLGSALITLAFKVGAVGETALKALGNILGGFFSSKCDIERGIDQLIVKLPESIFELAISVFIEIPIEGVATIVAMPFCPFTFSMMRHIENEIAFEESSAPMEKSKSRSRLENSGVIKQGFDFAFGDHFKIKGKSKQNYEQS